MPSQKDNRDEFTDQPVNGYGEKRETSGQEPQAFDIDAVSEMSQEEIERLLSQGTEEAQARSRWQPEGEDTEEDVLDMLEDSGDDDLQDIQDMLKKSERNETIDSYMDEDSYGDGPADKLLADIEEGATEAPVDSKTQKALEKQRRAQEKARQKEERAARKKAAREAARAERQSRKAHRKSDANMAQDAAEEEDSNEIKEFDLLLDKDLLDSIVSDAGNLGREEKAKAAEPERVDEAEDSPAAFNTQEILGRAEGVAGMERAESPGKGSEQDIMELDMDQVDALIPDVSESSRGDEKGGKKKGLVSKIVTLLTEEEEPENEDIPLSEENQEIIRDLDKEKASGKKAKNKAKKPAKKKEKKKKAPKPPKPKKEKKPKQKEPYVGKRITFRKALPILLLGATVGAVVFIFVYVATDYSVKQQAADAYAQGDYQTCYQNLYGKKLNEEERQMYVQAESLLYIQQMYRKYETYLRKGLEVEALDSLIQTVDSYPQLLEYASQWEMLPEMGEVYASMMGILSERYGITEEQARAIAAIKSDIVYTRTVTALAGGETSDTSGEVPGQNAGDSDSQPDEGAGEIDGAEELPDELPEESELEDGNFVDN